MAASTPNDKHDAPDSTVPEDLFGRVAAGAPPGPRALAEQDLLAWLTAQVQAFPGCAHVTVVGLFRLDAPDAEGCNWSRTLVLDPHGVSPDDYAPAYAAAVEKARKAFILAAAG